MPAVQQRDAPALGALAARLGVEFADLGLLRRAVTHRSASREHSERLEFLGDAALGLAVARALYALDARASEGELTRWRATLVRRETLAEVAREIELGRWLVLGPGERKAGARQRDAVLADALEAVLGAVLLDRGAQACEQLVNRLFGERIARVSEAPPAKDPKTRLQEWLQARSMPLPRYELLNTLGEEHERLFRVGCQIAPLTSRIEADGRSRRRAEQTAAALALEALGVG